ncbi:30S ribosomal protein S27ae [Candidatus Bathyarchaeota archaeon]|nr:30S ribosomal protein S27ae [Candidatus Bathyarchaeota archaeon]
MSKKPSEKETPTKEKAVEEVKEEKEVEKSVEKPAKAEKPQKKKKEEKGIFSLYKIESDKVTRLRPTCERCGPGYFMANHGNRYTCGHCGFTRYKPAEK